MVVRSLLGLVIYKLPYSDHLPEFVGRILNENDKIENGPSETSMGVSHPPIQEKRNAKKDIHDRIIFNRKNKYSDLSNGDNLTSTSLGSDRMFDKNTLVDSSSAWEEKEESYIRNARMKQYLIEQNNKFNELIDSNLETFLKQQQKFDEKDANKASLRELFKNGSQSYLNYLNTLSSILRHTDIYLLNSRKNTDQQNEIELRNRSKHYNSYDNGTGFHSPIFNNYLQNLNDSKDLELFVSSLTEDDKLILWNMLTEEIQKGSKLNDNEIDNNDSLNKIQSLIIVFIKLFFTSMKRIMPVLYLIYLKFSNDELYFVNKKNFNNFLTKVIYLLNSIDRLLNKGERRDNYDSLEHILNYEGNLNPHDPISSMANCMYKENTWSLTALKFMLSKYMNQFNQNNYNESPYLIPKANSAQSTESISSDNSQSVTFLNTAEQFVKEMA